MAMYMRRLALSSLVLICTAVLAVAGDVRSSGPELLMLEEDGCYWCEQWNEDIGGIYHKTEEGRRAPLRRLNIHDPLPASYGFLRKGNFTPTFVLVQNGREVGRIRGYPGADFFFPLLGQLLAKLRSPKTDG